MSIVNSQTRSRDQDYADLISAKEDQLADVPAPLPYFRRKALLDCVLAALMLTVGFPIIGLLVLLVRATSKGPGIYRQTRVGKDGRTFTMLKIRTMTHHAEKETGAVWTQPDDARITRVGCVLRKVHLDEFPQLINVLRGEMSLVGPRPERPEFVHVLAKEIPNYLHRLAIRPGITGLAQINLPPDTDLESVRSKLLLDLEYCRGANLLLDLRMMSCTFIRLMGFSGERAMRIMRLQRDDVDLDDAEAARRQATFARLLITPTEVKPRSNGRSAEKTHRKPR